MSAGPKARVASRGENASPHIPAPPRRGQVLNLEDIVPLYFFLCGNLFVNLLFYFIGPRLNGEDGGEDAVLVQQQVAHPPTRHAGTHGHVSEPPPPLGGEHV
eukprot:1187074-Prorocentrum_minimum.AAC.5